MDRQGSKPWGPGGPEAGRGWAGGPPELGEESSERPWLQGGVGHPARITPEACAPCGTWSEATVSRGGVLGAREGAAGLLPFGLCGGWPATRSRVSSVPGPDRKEGPAGTVGEGGGRCLARL